MSVAAKSEGWSSFFRGRDRDDCPFPMDRRDLREAYQEGWDNAKGASDRLKAQDTEPKFGNLTNAQRERLEMLAEEAAEVVKACTKILRHGYDSYNPNVQIHKTNALDLENELMDLWTVYERMADYGDLGRINFYDTPRVWSMKLKYTHHQPEFHHPTLDRGAPVPPRSKK